MKGIILYGPPASGKDTVTAALVAANSRCELFPRLKAGPGNMATYRQTTQDHIAHLRAKGDIVWENNRYGATYAVDKSELLDRLAHDVPVLHLGQVEAIEAVRNAAPDASWVTAELWCPRHVAAQRLKARNPLDIEERLRAWDETSSLVAADLRLDTDKNAPAASAQAILQLLSDK